MESEKNTERYLVKHVEGIGGLCYKVTSPGRKNVPDRVCLFPTGFTVWVEVKSEGDKPNDGQLREHARLKERGHNIKVIDTKTKIDKLIMEVKRELFRRV